MEKRFLTDNHVEIYHYPGQHLHSFCIGLYLRAGSMYESEEENGISHFLEHIVIRNINSLMEGKLYEYLDKRGLMFNACTYREFIQFELTGAKKHIRDGIDVMVRLLEPITLPAKEIQVERKRIKAEIREEDEKHSLSFFSGELVWKGTSLERTITGTSTGLDKMGKASLQKAHERLFSAENLFFYMTGNGDETDIAYLKKAVEAYEIYRGQPVRENLAPVPAEFFKRDGRVSIKKSSDTLVRFSFDLDTRAYSQPVYILLYDLLFDCENSKIHQALSEKSGFIYSFDPGMEQYGNIGNLYFQYEVQPAKLAESVEMAVELFRELKQGITDELDYVKPVYIDNGEMLLDHAPNLNWSQAYEGHILGKLSTDLEARKEAYAAVTPQELTSLAGDVFRRRNLVLTVKGKKSKRLQQQLERILETLDE